ncbi:hypothetical protein RHSP_44368 [Rhizobium freirei PRF 81]|uniref:UvrC family homology region profile domain-containing protein n=1 Tax=Rhizobium freirei PRF 81 TaxID=363754 RepID=N6V102_9HYPH|nr:SIR2 family protein [Rhizobium freirei]ENN87545.1 hypothetical protein RHSP_44368 [Rhizobium freirei PRF 81]
MTFKNITSSQHDAFISSLAAGQYNLLLGAGASMDSRNAFGLLPSGESFKEELCGVTGAASKHSLQRVFSLLREDQIEPHVTKRFSECHPGPTPKLLSHFIWKRLFTWNIDDVIENEYTSSVKKQRLISIHYKDEFREASNLSELMVIHLHGYVQAPEKGYVFSREHYIQQVQTINPWMSVLSTFIKSEPMVISGTSLDEPDLDYYLSYRSELTSRDDRGPSILVTKEDDAITADLCRRHNLLHFRGWTSEFLEYCKAKLPHPPTPEELIPNEFQALMPTGITRSASIAFHSDFELIPGSASPSTNSRFQYGHLPTWQDLAGNLDIARSTGADLVVQIEQMLQDATSPAKLLLLAERAGAGKTTVIRRAAFELAKRGIKTFVCSALSRIDRTTSEVLNAIEGPIVVLVDNFADQAAAIAETLGRVNRSDVVVLAAERSYRSNYLQTVLHDTNLTVSDSLTLSEIDAERLIDKYFETGNLGDHDILKHRKNYAKRLSKDPIAVACCRILNDFKPLERIVDDIIGDASEDEFDRYLCTALAQHCFMGGLRYEILLGAAERKGIRKQFDSQNPLPLAYSDRDRDYVVPENSTFAENVLERAISNFRPSLLRTFISLANELQPFVSRATIKRRTPEARLAGRLFDYDDISGKLLGNAAEQFYDATRERWKWNSRYWEQVALLNLANYQRNSEDDDAIEHLDQAVQHARHAVAIELHPFGLTTLGKILMTQMLVPGYSMTASFNEAFDRLAKAIEKEALWSRRAIQPFLALFRGTDRYLEHGGSLDAQQRDALRSHLTTADYRFSKENEVVEIVASLRRRVKL